MRSISAQMRAFSGCTRNNAMTADCSASCVASISAIVAFISMPVSGDGGVLARPSYRQAGTHSEVRHA